MFTARATLVWRAVVVYVIPPVRPSVCLSQVGTRAYVKTAESKITLYRSPARESKFWCQKSWRNSNEVTADGEHQMQVGCRKLCHYLCVPKASQVWLSTSFTREPISIIFGSLLARVLRSRKKIGRQYYFLFPVVRKIWSGVVGKYSCFNNYLDLLLSTKITWHTWQYLTLLILLVLNNFIKK